MGNISVKLFGFNAAAKMVASLKPMMLGASNELINTTLVTAQSIVVHHIDMQDLAWTPLSFFTVNKKGNSTILVDTSLYIQSIRNWRNANFGYVGVGSSDVYPDGTKLSTVAIDNEYGTQNIPARPLWQPSAKDVGAWRAGMTEAYIKQLLKKHSK